MMNVDFTGFDELEKEAARSVCDRILQAKAEGVDADLETVLTTWEYVKGMLIAHPFPYGSKPDGIYKEYLGMAFGIRLYIAEGLTASLDPENMGRWGVGIDEVWQAAVDNGGAPMVYGDLFDMGENVSIWDARPGKSFILNTGRYGGAVALFQTGVADRLMELLGTDELRISFTSCHEAVVFGTSMPFEDMRYAQAETNKTSIECGREDDVLTYDIICYTKDGGFSIAP